MHILYFLGRFYPLSSPRYHFISALHVHLHIFYNFVILFFHICHYIITSSKNTFFTISYLYILLQFSWFVWKTSWKFHLIIPLSSLILCICLFDTTLLLYTSISLHQKCTYHTTVSMSNSCITFTIIISTEFHYLTSFPHHYFTISYYLHVHILYDSLTLHLHNVASKYKPQSVSPPSDYTIILLKFTQ